MHWKRVLDLMRLLQLLFHIPTNIPKFILKGNMYFHIFYWGKKKASLTRGYTQMFWSDFAFLSSSLVFLPAYEDSDI